MAFVSNIWSAPSPLFAISQAYSPPSCPLVGLSCSPLRSLHLTRPCKQLPVFSVHMRLREVQTYDASFELKPECEEKLHRLLNSPTFRTQVIQQVAQQAGSTNGPEYEFTGELFQPVPWSITTKHGMPQEFEKYWGDADYLIINVPPNFMFQAKVRDKGMASTQEMEAARWRQVERRRGLKKELVRVTQPRQDI